MRAPRCLLALFTSPRHGCAVIARARVRSIPLKYLITVEMGKETPIGQKVVRARIPFEAPKHIYLMLAMLTDMQARGRVAEARRRSAAAAR